MPAKQRGPAYSLGATRGHLRRRAGTGRRHHRSPFRSKSAALAHYRNVVEPDLRGDSVPTPTLTVAELVPIYLERHGATVRPRTILTLRERLRYAVDAYGDVTLRDLERMSG